MAKLRILGIFAILCVCFVDNSIFNSIATIVITEQPFPSVLTKGKTFDEDEPVVVALLSGAGTQFNTFSNVYVLFCHFCGRPLSHSFYRSAVIVYENQQAKSTAKVFTRDSEPLDPTTRTATFRFKVNGGTRKLPVQVKFQVNTQVGAQALSIDSQPSEPFIVITNECQVSFVCNCTSETPLNSIYSV